MLYSQTSQTSCYREVQKQRINEILSRVLNLLSKGCQGFIHEFSP